MTGTQNPQDRAEGDGPAASGLDKASPRDLAELLGLGTDTIAPEPLPPPSPKRRHLPSAGIVFFLLVAGFVAAIGWWSWRMLEMGSDVRGQSKASSAGQSESQPPRAVSPWQEVAISSIPTDGRFIALEAAFNTEGTALLAAFSDGSARVYPLDEGVLGQPRILEGARAYPLAVTFGTDDRPRLITPDGKAIQVFDGAGGAQTQPIDPPLVEAYCWAPGILVSAPNPFDGGILVQHGAAQETYDGVRFVGADPQYRRLAVADRTDLTRIGVLDLTGRSLRFISAPKQVERAALSPAGDQITAVLVDGSITCLDAMTGEVRWRRDPVPGVAGRSYVTYTPTGEIILAEYRLLLLDPDAGGVLADLTPASELPLATFDMRLSPDGHHLCVLGNDLHVLTRR